MIFQILFFLFFIPLLFSDCNSYRVIGIGNAAVDLLISVNDEFLEQHVPGPKGGSRLSDFEFVDHLIEISHETPKIVPGGSCANTIRGLAKLGERCAFYAPLSSDFYGKFFAKSLEDCGIIGVIKTFPDYTTPRIISMINTCGERTMLAAFSTPPDEFFLQPEHFKDVQWTHFETYQLYFGDIVEKAMELAKKEGSKISLDLSSFSVVLKYKDILDHLLSEYVDLVFANEDETFALTGLSAEEGCRKLQEICPFAVVTIGAKGCLVGHEGKVIAVPAFPAQVVDTTGAGDLFASGFLYGMLNGFPLEECGCLGNRLGSSIVEVVGAELPEEKWTEIYQFLEQPKQAQALPLSLPGQRLL